MPDKVVYVRQADMPIWEQATKLASDGNVSNFVMEAVRDAVVTRSAELAERDEFHQVVVRVGAVEKEFTGRLLGEWEDLTPAGEPTQFDRGDPQAEFYYDIYPFDRGQVFETPKGGIGVVLEEFRMADHYLALIPHQACETTLTVFASADELAAQNDTDTPSRAAAGAWGCLSGARRPRIRLDF